MSTSAAAVRFDDVTTVDLVDGRTIGVTGAGLHREALDEDIAVEGLLAGRGDMTIKRSVAA